MAQSTTTKPRTMMRVDPVLMPRGQSSGGYTLIVGDLKTLARKLKYHGYVIIGGVAPGVYCTVIGIDWRLTLHASSVIQVTGDSDAAHTTLGALGLVYRAPTTVDSGGLLR
jgi:hypothetical protein